jgi:dTDP-glucose 4,6-dehydratase
MKSIVTGSAGNIGHINSDGFTYLKHDVTKPIYFRDKIHYIFHLASPASPIDYLDLPIQTLKAGALGTYNMLGLAKEQNARFLLASTSEVYGDPLINPQPETYWGNVNPIGPRMRANDGRVVPNFIGQALKGEDITVYGDGKQTRSFCYVSDLINGIYRLMMSDFVERVIEIIGSNSKIVFEELPVDDPKVSEAGYFNSSLRNIF